jgi:hypothetical protein
VDEIKLHQPAGKQQVTWTPEKLPSGIYYFKLQARYQVATGKVVKM